jgi:sec-independent protein translocase protein TatC
MKAGASMPLVQHFQELRKRVFKAAFGITVFSFIGWFFYDKALGRLTSPICNLGSQIQNKSTISSNCGILYVNGILGPIDLKFKISLLIGIVFASPIWIYQAWAYISPALTRKEKIRSRIFGVFALPFFAIGIFVGYLILPIAIKALLGFTPSSVANLVKLDDYLSFVTKLLLVFGFAFELPVFLVALSAIGILKAKTIFRPWRYAIFGILVFAAIFTPTGDPVTMLLLAIPLIALYFLAGGIATILDSRRFRRRNNSQDSITA